MSHNLFHFWRKNNTTIEKSIIEKGLLTYGIGATSVLGYGAAQEQKKKQSLLEM